MISQAELEQLRRHFARGGRAADVPAFARSRCRRCGQQLRDERHDYDPARDVVTVTATCRCGTATRAVPRPGGR